MLNLLMYYVSFCDFCTISSQDQLPTIAAHHSLTHCGLVTPYVDRSRSTLAQVMACCLKSPGHYLNQCWIIISKVQWHSSVGSFTSETSAINQWNYLENNLSKISFKSPRGQWVNTDNKPVQLHHYYLPGCSWGTRWQKLSTIYS